MLVVFIGPPGAGKGTQAKRLREHLAVPHISTGELMRNVESSQTDLGNQVGECLRRGELVPDDLVIGIVEQRIGQPDCENGCLFDGFPRTVTQAVQFDHCLKTKEKSLDLAVALSVTRPELISRLSARGRRDDTPETIANRLDVYDAHTLPLLAYYEQRGILANVDGTGSEDEVFERIKQAIDRHVTETA